MTSLVGAILILAGFVGNISDDGSGTVGNIPGSGVRWGTVAIIAGVVYLLFGLGVEIDKIIKENAKKPN